MRPPKSSTIRRSSLTPTLGASNLDALQLVELDAGRHHVHHVVAALHEGVQAREQRAVLELPRVVGGVRNGDTPAYTLRKIVYTSGN